MEVEETVLSLAPLTVVAVSIVVVLMLERARRRSYKRPRSPEPTR
jgi:hypothetical protein